MEWNEIKPVTVSQSNYFGVLRIVYYPGMACSNWRRHSDRSADIVHGFIMGDSRTLCPKCLQFQLGKKISTNAVDKTHWMPHHWDADTIRNWQLKSSKKYWKMIEICSLIQQITILTDGVNHGLGFEKMLDTSEKDLYINDKKHILAMIRSYGVGEQDDWDKELAESEMKLTQWRDDAFRIKMLIEVLRPYGQDDTHDAIKPVLDSLARYVRNKPLTDKQRKMFMSFESSTLHERLEFTKYQGNLVKAR